MRLTIYYLGEQSQMQGSVWLSYKAKVSGQSRCVYRRHGCFSDWLVEIGTTDNVCERL
jgi:hypothetical protein